MVKSRPESMFRLEGLFAVSSKSRTSCATQSWVEVTGRASTPLAP